MRLFRDRPTPFHIPEGKGTWLTLADSTLLIPEASNTNMGSSALLTLLKIPPATDAQLQPTPAHPEALVTTHLFFWLSKRVTGKHLALPPPPPPSPGSCQQAGYLLWYHLLRHPLWWVCPGRSLQVIFVLHSGHVEEEGTPSVSVDLRKWQVKKKSSGPSRANLPPL